ncbi:hypothetical protein BDN72DRAFT_831155 [Pluteus cervinus]|uniref:Uncharacterized protein n=1 Tax=Pluteus cervinus TaxID=181527 RepID=A0ACD3BEE6_9AGAR|nr:hypothetical protein BDN72DRAFT_831155 [Pluteus cervinus]
MDAPTKPYPRAVAVYCGSSLGKQKAYLKAAESLGKALAAAARPLVYGGGSKGIMGVVSTTVSEAGGKVTGVIPFAMVRAGGEKESVGSPWTVTPGEAIDNVESIVVGSMHERKVEMAKRVSAFAALPGGYGTFEEVMEVTTWTQLGIHNKPVVVLNVLGFFEPLRQLINNGVEENFIQPYNKDIIVFVDGPESREEHESYDWGRAALKAIDSWEWGGQPLYDWTTPQDGAASRDTLDAT